MNRTDDDQTTIGVNNPFCFKQCAAKIGFKLFGLFGLNRNVNDYASLTGVSNIRIAAGTFANTYAANSVLNHLGGILIIADTSNRACTAGLQGSRNGCAAASEHHCILVAAISKERQHCAYVAAKLALLLDVRALTHTPKEI